LQILLAHERGLRGRPDLLGVLRAEILAVVSRHIVLDPEKVTVKMDRSKHVSTDQLRSLLHDADSDSDIPGPGFSSERTVVRRRPLKSLDLGPASPVY
jgi:septum formation topological specificity factor MinE